MKSYQEFNDSLDRDDRRHKGIAYFFGLAGFLIVLTLVVTFLYQLAQAVAGK